MDRNSDWRKFVKKSPDPRHRDQRSRPPHPGDRFRRRRKEYARRAAVEPRHQARVDACVLRPGSALYGKHDRTVERDALLHPRGISGSPGGGKNKAHLILVRLDGLAHLTEFVPVGLFATGDGRKNQTAVQGRRGQNCGRLGEVGRIFIFQICWFLSASLGFRSHDFWNSSQFSRQGNRGLWKNSGVWLRVGSVHVKGRAAHPRDARFRNNRAFLIPGAFRRRRPLPTPQPSPPVPPPPVPIRRSHHESTNCPKTSRVLQTTNPSVLRIRKLRSIQTSSPIPFLPTLSIHRSPLSAFIAARQGAVTAGGSVHVKGRGGVHVKGRGECPRQTAAGASSSAADDTPPPAAGASS